MLSTLIHRLTSSWPVSAAAMHLLWPWRCQLCGRSGPTTGGEAICELCAAALNNDRLSVYCVGCGREFSDAAAQQSRCPACQKHRRALEAVALAGRYGRRLQQCIVHWKFNGCLGLEPELVGVLSDTLLHQPWQGEVEALVPIPQPRVRWLQRGLAWPVRQLANGVSRKTGHCVWPILRARAHRPQVGLSRSQRQENVRGAFYVGSGIDLRGKRLCVVDDVMTTGATLQSAARELRKAGAAQVWGLVVAKTLGTAKSGAKH